MDGGLQFQCLAEPVDAIPVLMHTAVVDQGDVSLAGQAPDLIDLFLRLLGIVGSKSVQHDRCPQRLQLIDQGDQCRGKSRTG